MEFLDHMIKCMFNFNHFAFPSAMTVPIALYPSQYLLGSVSIVFLAILIGV